MDNLLEWTTYLTATDWEYSYDHVGNLVNATDGTVSITYTYDAGGRRVSRSDGVNTVYYVYDGLNLIEERDGLNNVLAEYIYDGALHPRKAIIGGNAYYFQQDVLGNVTALTNENGEIVETYEYDIYGKPMIRDENGDPVATPMTPFLFTGHYWDTDAGLYLTMYRAYSPDLGRWLTRDPINLSGRDMNLYRYVLNNPVSTVDHDGLSKKEKSGVNESVETVIEQLISRGPAVLDVISKETSGVPGRVTVKISGSIVTIMIDMVEVLPKASLAIICSHLHGKYTQCMGEIAFVYDVNKYLCIMQKCSNILKIKTKVCASFAM
jgi:RHS repeat-associated protein